MSIVPKIKKMHRLKEDWNSASKGPVETRCEKEGIIVRNGPHVFLVTADDAYMRIASDDASTTCRLCIRSMLGFKLTIPKKHKFVYRRPAPHIRRADKRLGLLKP